MEVLHALWWCFLFLTCVKCIPQSLLYEYATYDSQNLPRGDDISSSKIPLKVPIVFYGTKYDSIYVNTNGLLTFQAEIPTFLNTEFPLPDPLIAPLYSNVDTTNAGTVSYYESSKPELLKRATDTIHDTFTSSYEFQATSLFIATWNGVGYHERGSDKTNTFQAIIATDGDDSYVEFIYPENALQWIQGTGDKESGLPDARAQAGFIAPDGRFFALPGSGTDQVRNLDKWTNMNVPGQWIFRIGLIDLDVTIEEPDLNNDAGLLTGPPSCAKASTYCHSQATCKDYDGGVCCQCSQDYYGNGRYCIKRSVPLRVNGKVNGRVNGEKLEDLDLQAYVVMVGARAYTAISKVPESVGYDIQSLHILGAVIGWLFAEPVGDSLNGYQLTGGVFNHTATLFFTNTSQKVVIRQKYIGLDVFDQLRLECDIQGDIPVLPDDSKIVIPEYREEYTVTSPGVIQSSASRYFTYTNLDQQEIVQAYSINQNFVFDSCKFDSAPAGTTWRLRVDKNFIGFDSKEQIIRYGMSNKIGPLGDFNPCDEGRSKCGPNSACVVDGDSYRCECSPGYQYIYRENDRLCVDIDECQSGAHDCDLNAECLNQLGTFICRCNPGYEGNGRFCQNSMTCQNVQCSENARCVENGVARCECLEGFRGNGQTCTPVADQSCHVANNCSPYAVCAISEETQSYSCTCLPGYEGDGYTCNPEEPAQFTTEAGNRTHQKCLLGVCWCPAGYKVEKDSSYCVASEETTEYPTDTPTAEVIVSPEIQCYNTVCFCPKGFYYEQNSNACLIIKGIRLESKGYSGNNISCNVINNCHKDAQCIFALSSNSYQCICNYGYEGDGYYCSAQPVSCAQADNCDIHATCTYDEQKGRSVCVCNPGYEGDGYQCQATAICITNEDCPETEECLYMRTSQQYECDCKEGLMRDSQHQCVKLTGTCGGGTCVKNAECLYDDEYETYYCSCKSDYVGDGITKCTPRPVGCNVVNNCGLHALCKYDPQSTLYQCMCEDGFYGDGFICYKEKNCNVEPSLCDPRATCVASASRRYVCECNFGYTGNGTICKPNPRHEGNFLLLNQGMATFKIPFEPTKTNPGKLLHRKHYQMAIGLDIDCLAGRVYWSDVNGKAIRSSSYNESKTTDFITNDIGSPEGLSIDWVSRNIYWTDSTRDTVEVANLETKLRKTLFDTNLVNPRGIAVHPQRGKIFWADWDRKSPKIEWANADGTDRQIFLQGESVKLPNSLVIDFDTEQLCYADAGTKTIECVDIDTRTKHTIAVNCTYPFGIAVTDRHIYWSDWISKKIERVEKRSLVRLSPLQIPLGLNINKLYGLVAVPERCPSLTNVCQFYKDQCPSGHICLPNGSGTRSCVCGFKSDSPLEKPICDY